MWGRINWRTGAQHRSDGTQTSQSVRVQDHLPRAARGKRTRVIRGNHRRPPVSHNAPMDGNRGRRGPPVKHYISELVTGDTITSKSGLPVDDQGLLSGFRGRYT